MIMRKILPAILLFFSSSMAVKAQHQEISESPEIYKGKQVQIADSTSLLVAFKKGQVNGHFRYFFMSTQNKNGLSDYYAHAAGGGLRYQTAFFHGFRFAISGFYTFNIGSSDLGKPDPQTGQLNRYEIGLFDMENPYNKKNIARLEELLLEYRFRNSSLTFGKQLINTPFINLQDGRMHPTGAEGLRIQVNEIKKLKIETGWLYAFSPRGTTRWYSTGRSIGVYPAGVNADGTKSGYSGNLESKGVFYTGINAAVNKRIKIQGWDFFTENIFNTMLLQADLDQPIKNNSSFYASIQFIRQDAVNNGGNNDPAKAYFKKGQKAISFGTRAGWKNKQWEAAIHYNRITAHGRYLVPREWGRDPFFTFLPRERNEGFGDVHAVMGKINYSILSAGLKVSFAAGYYKLPDVTDYRLNKYGVPSYIQVNADARYAFKGLLKGLDAQLLVTGKLRNGETYNNPKFEFNKVSMILYNFVLNYHF